MTTVVPMPLTLPRYTTEEAEDVWLSTNGGGLDSVSSNVSNISDLAASFANDVTAKTNWWDNHADSTPNGNDDKFIDDANWLATAGLTDEIEVVTDSEMITAQPIPDDTTGQETPVLAHPVDCDWNDIFPDMDDVESNSAEDDDVTKAEDDIPIAKRSKKVSDEVLVSDQQSQKPPQMPDKLLQATSQTRKSNRTRKTKTTKATPNSADKKKKPPRRRKVKGDKSKKKLGPVSPMSTKRKRDERLRRNRESANRSRIRKKKEMQELKENVVVLRQKVVTLSNKIEELETSNQGLRERLAMYKKPNNSYKPAVTVFALVFTVAFFAQPSAVPQVGLSRLPGQGASKVMNGFGKFGQGSRTFLLAPLIDLFSNSAIDAAISTPMLPTIVSAVSKIFIAFALASICAVCFYYFGTMRMCNEQRHKVKCEDQASRVSFLDEPILDTV